MSGAWFRGLLGLVLASLTLWLIRPKQAFQHRSDGLNGEITVTNLAPVL
jgi:hypothetical protein